MTDGRLDPAEIKAHQEKVAKWERETAAWKARRQEAVGRLKAHGKDTTFAGGRRKLLTAAELEQLRKVGDPQAIYDQYVRHLEDFMQMHLDSGGIEPVRISYSKPHLRSARAYAARGGAKMNVKASARRVRRCSSSGRSAWAATTTSTPARDPRERHAQRLRVGLGMHQLLVGGCGTYRHRGCRGRVAVSEKNMAAGQAEHRLSAQSDIKRSPATGEAGLQRNSADELTAMGKAGTGDVTTEPPTSCRRPPGSDARVDEAVPQASYERPCASTSALISLFPARIGNTLGSLPLAFVAGAGPHQLQAGDPHDEARWRGAVSRRTTSTATARAAASSETRITSSGGMVGCAAPRSTARISRALRPTGPRPPDHRGQGKRIGRPPRA